MPKLLQVWQYGPPHAWERTLGEAINTARTYGFDGLAVKALDGSQWMAIYDDDDAALGAIEEARAQYEQCQAAGLSYYVWTNPLANEARPDSLDWQADVSAELAMATDGLLLDAEPYGQFWGAWRPVGLARRFMERIRAYAPDAWIGFQPDPRPGRLEELRPEEWLPSCNVLAGQHYWSTFGSDARLELEYARHLGARYGLEVWPTLPGNAPPESFPLDLIAQFPGCVVWRMGSTPTETLALLGGIAMPAEETPPSAHPCASLIEGLAHAADVLGDQLLAETRRRLASGRPGAVRKTVVRQIVAQVQAIRAERVGPRP